MGYAEGFEDAVELCLHELRKAKDMKDAEERIQNIVDLVKERKFDRIKYLLTTL